MAAWSRHYKGPVAKQELHNVKPKPIQQSNALTGNLSIQTKNSLPDKTIQQNILENQAQIKNWINPCKEHDEEIVVVSAGLMMIAEDLEPEIKAGRKIVAVKHALDPLKASGIKPWACILLDPREHLTKFVENPDTDVIWFVASQVDPRVVKKLLDSGCNVWGYHASVGAGEDHLTERQYYSIIRGGSATATRGLYVLNALGFRRFRLYGYDLCYPDKPNLNEKDEFGQMKYFEVSIEAKATNYQLKRAFWSKGELLAQYQEMNDLVTRMPWEFKAFGQGIVPFMVNAKRISDLREKRKKDKLNLKSVTYKELLNGSTRPDAQANSPRRRSKPATNTGRTRAS